MSWKLEDKVTIDPQVTDNIPIGQQNGSSYNIKKTSIQKLRDFFLGTTALTTTDTTISGAIEELKGNVDSNTASLSDVAHKTGTMQTNLNADMIDGIQGNQIPLKTTADITYYVLTTGLDTNNGLTSGTAFKTITKAISLIPQIVNHTITINVASGIYNEIPTFSGKDGSGTIILNGDTVVSSTRTTTAINCMQCTCKIVANGFKLSYATGICFYAISCSRVEGNYLNMIDVSSSYGVALEYSKGIINSSVISNKQSAIISNQSMLTSSTNSGTGNTASLQAINSGVIGKIDTQPSGTTAEVTSGGGVIR